MANSDKDILITPNTGSSSANPKIEYVGADSSGNDTITVETLYDGTKATLSFEGSAGQLFSVVNDLTNDPIFSVNDVSGIPSIEVDSDGEIRLAEFSGNVGIGTSSPGALLDVNDENAVSRIRISRGGTDLSTSTDIGSLDFYADFSSSPIHYGGLKAYANNLSGVRGSLDFYVKSTSGNVLTGMTLYGTNSGVYVGIGTQTPSSLLDVDGIITANNLTLQNLSAQNSEATAVMIDGSGIIGTRELGSNAFNSTAFLTGNQTITLSGDVSGSGTTSIAVTIADDSHNHVISNVDGLQTALDAKLTSSSGLNASNLTSGTVPSARLATGGSGDWWSGNVVKVGADGVSEVGKYLDFHNTDTGTSDFDTRLYSSGTDQLTINGSGRIFTDGYHPNADAWTTSRTITLAGDVTGNVSIDGSANVTLTAAVVDDSHNHVISNVDGLQTALDGKLSTTGTAANSQLLDSLDSTAFLRSNADDTVSNQITFPSAIGNRPILQGGFLSRLSSDGDADIWGISETYYPSEGTASNAWGIRWASTPNEIQFVGANQNKLRIDLDTAGKVYIDNNEVWHAGNDGSGSGLDADLLDSQHGSYYLDYNNFTNTPTIPSLSGYATETYVNTQVSNLVDSAPGTLDTLNELAAALGDDANFSTTVTNSIATKAPIASPSFTTKITTPQIHHTGTISVLNGTSAQGMKVLSLYVGTSYNNSAASGQVNTLNGYRVQGTEVINSSGNWVGGGNISEFTNNSGYITGNQTITLSGDVSGSGTTSISVTVADDSHNHVISNVDGLQTALDAKLASSSYTAADVLTKIKTVDGSGSGLDADTVDGKHKDFLMHYKGIVSGNWDTIFSQTDGHMGVYQVQNISGGSHSNYPTSAYTYGGVLSWQLDDSTFKLYAPHIGSLHYQTGWNNDEYSGWRKLWDSGNDGSGSGLDADLLDGQHGSYYAPSSTALTTSTSFGGDVSGTYNAIVVADDSHNHVISNVDGLQTALDGKLSTSGTAANSQLLDSIDSSQFLRSDADDTATGKLYFTGGSSTDPALHIKSGGSSWSEGMAIHPLSDSGYALTFYRTKASFTDQTNTWALGNLGGSGFQNYFGLLRKGLTGGIADRTTDAAFTISPSGTFKFGFNPYVGSNQIWHAGNDGSGSGLDADSLRGYVPSESAAANSIVKREGSGHIYGNYILGSYFNASSGNSENPTIGQIWTQNTSDNYLRKSTPAHFISQLGLFTTSNDGSGSGLDADLLDGQHGSYYTGSKGASNNYVASSTSTSNRGNFGAGVWAYSGYSTGTNRPFTYDATLQVMPASNMGFELSVDWLSQTSTPLKIRSLRDCCQGWSDYSTVWTSSTDGSGSGLDADLLDGVQAASFLRSDTADTATGTITISGLDQSLFAQKNVSGANWSGRIISSNTTTGVASFLGNYNGYAGVFAHNSALDAWAPIYINTLSTGSGAANVYLGTTYINGSTAWHAGNDGSGSGLDADLLDGQDNTFYRNASNLNAGTLDNARLPAAITVSSDIQTTGGLLRFTSNNHVLSTNNANNPLLKSGGSGAMGLLGQDSGSNFRWQLYGDGSHYGFLDGNWANWDIQKVVNGAFYVDEGSGLQRVWNAGNDGSGSGLDADLLDGFHLNGSSDSIGYKVFNNQGRNHNTQTNFNDTSLRAGINYLQGGTNGPTGTGSHQFYGFRLGLGDDYGTQTGQSGHYASELYWARQTLGGGGYLWARDMESGSWQSWRKMSAGYADSAGSATNADTVDSLHASSFLRSDAANNNYLYVLNLRAGGNHLGNHEFAANTNQTSYSNSSIELREANYGSSSAYSAPRIAFHWGGVVASSIAINTSGDFLIQNNPGTGYENLKAGTIYSSDNLVWSAGNDGSGSGLDADLLDGINSTGFFRQSGSWLGDLGSNGYTRENGLTMTGGSEFVILSKSGQGSVLIDGHYISYESNNGFFGSYTSSYGSASGIRATAADTVSVMQLDGGSANLAVTGDIYGKAVDGAYSNLYRFGGIYFTWDSDTYGTALDHSITSSDGGTYGDHITLNSYGNVRINFDSNSNGTNYFRIGAGTTGTGNVLLTIDEAGNGTFAGNVTAYSDIRLKENIVEVDNALDKICSMRGVYYNMIADETKSRRIGLVAQEVEKVLPEVVIEATPEEDKEKVLSIDYGNIVALLIEGMKEQQETIEKLTSRINDLEKGE